MDLKTESQDVKYHLRNTTLV